MLKRLRGLFSRPQPTIARQPQAPLSEAEGAPPKPAPAAPVTKEPSPLENPQAYLERVQAKINKLAEEFANGSINRLQFQELYDHYRREQQTVKRYLDMAPDSEEWKSATSEGKSVVIRQQNVAKVLGYSVYENESGMPLNTIGDFEIEAELAVPMLSSYRTATKEIFGAGMRSASEPFARLLAQRAREKLGATWGLAETGAAGPTGNRYGDAPGHACIAVSGPIESVITLETASADREANMWRFAREALSLLESCLRRA